MLIRSRESSIHTRYSSHPFLYFFLLFNYHSTALAVLLLYYIRAVRGRPVSLRVFLKSSLFIPFGLRWHRASSGTEERQIDQCSPLYILCTVSGVALICASKQMRPVQNLQGENVESSALINLNTSPNTRRRYSMSVQTVVINLRATAILEHISSHQVRQLGKDSLTLLLLFVYACPW